VVRSHTGLVRLIASGGALILGVALGCFGDLPRGRSCGDGWWDPEYEPCDDSSSDRSWVDACREQHGLDKDAQCDPITCELRASELFCSECGDGIASGNEECDGNDVRGASCPSGSGVVRCTDQCKLDFELCPAVCGDGLIGGTEECEPGLACGDDSDCGPGRACYQLIGECVPTDGGFGVNRACSYYNTTALGMQKPYASGNVSRCTDKCSFGRNKCGFCGDGERDDPFMDFVYPGPTLGQFPAEFCDGKDALQEDIQAHCEPLCVKEAINADVVVLCEFQCNTNCTGFAPPEDIVPSPDALGCCLAKNSPCPLFDKEGVPDLPCCSWAQHPEWVTDEEKCVPKVTDQFPITRVCR
jgi:hypothetical protein